MNRTKDFKIRIETTKSLMTVSDAVIKARNLSKRLNIGVEFMCNDVLIYVEEDYFVDNVVELYKHDLAYKKDNEDEKIENDAMLRKCPWSKPLRFKIEAY